MSDLRQAAQQALERLEACVCPPSVHHDIINPLRTALEQQQAEPDRRDLQAAGTHPAPCARHCEAKAFEIEIRGLKSQLKQQAEPAKYTEAELLAYGRAEFARALLLAAAAARPYGLAGETIALRILQIDGIFEDNAREAKP